MTPAATAHVLLLGLLASAARLPADAWALGMVVALLAAITYTRLATLNETSVWHGIAAVGLDVASMTIVPRLVGDVVVQPLLLAQLAGNTAKDGAVAHLRLVDAYRVRELVDCSVWVVLWIAQLSVHVVCGASLGGGCV